MMAAISAKRHHPEFSVVIIDRTFALGRKILVCGAGRCNITNINLNQSVKNHYYGADVNFTQSVFDQLNYEGIVKFFNDLGIELYVERKTDIGKLFPVTDQAKTVTELLFDELDRLGVEVYLNTEVKRLSVIGNQLSENREPRTENFEIAASRTDDSTKKTEELILSSTYIILSAGGKTYPALGSNGSGYPLIEGFGHRIIQPVPSALPLVILENQGKVNQFIHELQGVKLEIEVTSIISGKEIKTRSDDVMFTNYGLSGPAILNISREISIRINREAKSDVEVKLNFFPGKSREEVSTYLQDRWNKRPDQKVEKSLYGIFPNKIAASIIKYSGIETYLLNKDLQNSQKENLINILTNLRIKISGTRGWNEAEFTAGGLDTQEVISGTLESKKIKSLYFAGEILDVDGDVGGFNLSWAWASGFVSGKLISGK